MSGGNLLYTKECFNKSNQRGPCPVIRAPETAFIVEFVEGKGRMGEDICILLRFALVQNPGGVKCAFKGSDGPGFKSLFHLC